MSWLISTCVLIFFSRQSKVPSAPRIPTIPLPPVDEDTYPGGSDHHQSTKWEDISNQGAEVLTSLAAAKPNIIENGMQSEVSEFFTPLKIMLYNDVLDSSQTLVGLRPIRPHIAACSTVVRLHHLPGGFNVLIILWDHSLGKGDLARPLHTSGDEE